jgi:chromosome partitioning protein
LRAFAIANQKGGVGKTTTAVSIAGILSANGKRTLMMDLDPHGSLTVYFRLDPDSVQHSTYQLFEAEQKKIKLDMSRLICATRFENLYLLPASSAMVVLDKQIGSSGGMGLVIQHALADVAQEFDYVIMDCAPQLGILMVNALAACDTLIIPVQTEFLAIKGLERMLRTIQMIAKAKHMQLPYSILPTMYDARTRASQGSLKSLRHTYTQCLWHSQIPIDTQFRDASKKGIPMPLFAPNHHGTLAYREYVADLLSGEWAKSSLNSA